MANEKNNRTKNNKSDKVEFYIDKNYRSDYFFISNFLKINLYWITNSFQCFEYYNCYKTLQSFNGLKYLFNFNHASKVNYRNKWIMC